jgi:hypothetical protein
MNFQKIVLIVATMILIVVLVIIGISLSKSMNNNWPPTVADCPDYWIDLSGNGQACFNTHGLGKCNIPSESDKLTMNFNQSPFIGSNGICAKYKWAKNCQVTWDGITSGVKNPCDESN